MKWLIPLAILIFFECVADIFAKEWSLKGGWVLSVGALVAYFLANTFWLFALQNGSGLARGAVIFFISSTVIAVILGVFMYRESLSQLQFVGVILGVVALIFIFLD